MKSIGETVKQQARITITNESVTITGDGIWIQPVLSKSFRFTGSIGELISIMISHHELDIDNARFYVRAKY